MFHFPDGGMRRKPLLCFAAKASVFAVLYFATDQLLGRFLEKGLQRSYGLDTPVDVLCLGHSHTELGIDHVSLEKRLGLKVAKYARSGVNAADRYVMLRHYLEGQSKPPRVVIYDVDAHAFTGEGLSVNSYRLFFPFMDSPSVSSYVRASATPSEYYLRRFLRLARFDTGTCNAALRGWSRNWANMKYGTVDLPRLQSEIATGRIRRISFEQECIDWLLRTLEHLKKAGIHCVLLYIPTIDTFNSAEPAQYTRAIELLRSIDEQYDNVTFWDYNPAYSARHELFYDPIHLNPEGQRVVTERLAQDLTALLAARSNIVPPDAGTSGSRPFSSSARITSAPIATEMRSDQANAGQIPAPAR